MLGSCFSTELFYSDVAKIAEALEKLAFDTVIITIAEDMTISVCSGSNLILQLPVSEKCLSG